MSFKCPLGAFLAIALAGAASARAQEASAAGEVAKIQEQLEAELLNLKVPLKTLQERYRSSLAKQKANFQAAGKLKETLEVDAELRSLANGNDEPLSTQPDLKRLQEIYRAQRDTIQKNGLRNRLSIIEGFRKNAADLGDKLTREGKIEEARIALAEADRLEAMGKGFTNSLGMEFAPVPGTGMLFCVHEVRWKDYEAYAKANPGIADDWRNQTHDGFALREKSEDHPVVHVSWEDAKAFCAWLSNEEKKEGRVYRLPTDHEWSLAVGIGEKEDQNARPEEKNGKIAGEYPWGSEWPPPPGAGNYSDQSRKEEAPPTRARARYLDAYDDGFPTTSPVMSFKPNPYGLYDLGGNVFEWVEDHYTPVDADRVVRGGPWTYDSEFGLRSSLRSYSRSSSRGAIHGFRCVATPVFGESTSAWTSTDGRTFQGTMLYLEGENVVLQRNDGAVFSVPLGRLSENSRAAATAEAAAPLDPKERDAKLTAAFTLFGGWISLSRPLTAQRNDPVTLEIMNETLVVKSLVLSWPIAVRRFGKEVVGASHVFLETTEEPDFIQVRGILGLPDSTEMEKNVTRVGMEIFDNPALIVQATARDQPHSTEKEDIVTWCKYGWCHFGVSNGKVVKLRGDCKVFSH